MIFLLCSCIRCVVCRLSVLFHELLRGCVTLSSSPVAWPKYLTCEHTSLNQLQREIKESINFAFTRSCTEGIVSYSFWAPQVRAAPTLKKTAMWTTFPPRTAPGRALARGPRSPTAAAAAAGRDLWRRATMATPNSAPRRRRKRPAPFCQRTP